jgi:hypothetical protein
MQHPGKRFSGIGVDFAGHLSSQGKSSGKSKRFFFEKKQQKTLGPCGRRTEGATARR